MCHNLSCGRLWVLHHPYLFIQAAFHTICHIYIYNIMIYIMGVRLTIQSQYFEALMKKASIYCGHTHNVWAGIINTRKNTEIPV